MISGAAWISIEAATQNNPWEDTFSLTIFRLLYLCRLVERPSGQQGGLLFKVRPALKTLIDASKAKIGNLIETMKGIQDGDADL